MTWKTSLILLAVLVIAGVAFVALRSRQIERSHPNALWHVVHDLCVPDETKNQLPAPCLQVDIGKGYAVLKDQSGQTQVLLIPTARVTGIESPEVLGTSAPDYWEDAWDSRSYVERFARRPIPRDDIALAINSIFGRSQNQLHIHVDCVRPDVKQALAANLDRIRPKWSNLDVALAGRRYLAMWLPGQDLADRNPFDLLRDGVPDARKDMGRETLAVVPATQASGEAGFVLLADRADLAQGDNGHAEYLQDHSCQVLEGAS